MPPFLPVGLQRNAPAAAGSPVEHPAEARTALQEEVLDLVVAHAFQHGRDLPVAGDEDRLRLGILQKVGKAVSDLRHRYDLHDPSPR